MPDKSTTTPEEQEAPLLLDGLASYARTALDDPEGLPEGELDEAIEDAEAYDRVYADAAPAPAVQYAIGKLDEIIGALNPAEETRETFAASLTMLGRHIQDRLDRMSYTVEAEEPDKSALEDAARLGKEALDLLDEAIDALDPDTEDGTT